MKCKLCGKELITCEIKAHGFPGYHVKNSKKEYCGYCGPIPVMTLDNSTLGKITLIQDST